MADKLVRFQDWVTQEIVPVRLVDNGDGTWSLTVSVGNAAAAGVYVRPGTAATWQLAAGEAHVGEVAVGGKAVAQTPTITAGAYSAKDAVGGLLTFANAVRVSGGMGVIESVVVTDLAMQSAELVLVLFDRTFTAMADNAAWDPSDADMANCEGHIVIGTGNYRAFTDNAEATVTDQPLHFACNGTSLFGQLYCTGTPTYASTTDLTVKLKIRYLN